MLPQQYVCIYIYIYTSVYPCIYMHGAEGSRAKWNRGQCYRDLGFRTVSSSVISNAQ